MNEKLDLIKLLNDCPKGMPLNCTIFDGSVTFNGIVDDDLYPIEIKIDNDYEERLNKYGGYNNSPYCKCVIFPKGKTSWEGFQRPFKSGDILYVDCNDDDDTYEEYQYIFILKEINGDEIHCYCYIDNADGSEKFETCLLATMKYTPRFASLIEKEKLFDAIKSRGYKWNDTTKTLEKLIEPKFKVGDTIRSKKNSLQEYKITDVSSEYYSTGIGRSCVSLLPIKDQDDFILIPNRFDIKSLQPFDRVLVSCNDEWFCDFFSHYDDAVNKFNCTCTGGCPYEYCIPYNDDTKHLIGKSIEDTPEFYKYWE